MRIPGEPPRRVDDPLTLAALPELIRAAARADIPRESPAGQTLARFTREEAQQPLLSEVNSPSLAVRSALLAGSWKILFNPPNPREEPCYAAHPPPEYQLFDLANDPGERTNLLQLAPTGALARDAAQPAAFASLRQRLEQVRAQLEKAGKNIAAVDLDAGTMGETREALQQLGYVSGQRK
jgi:hypothetical protein